MLSGSTPPAACCLRRRRARCITGIFRLRLRVVVHWAPQVGAIFGTKHRRIQNVYHTSRTVLVVKRRRAWLLKLAAWRRAPYGLGEMPKTLGGR